MDDDNNQDPYGDDFGGRVFGRGAAQDGTTRRPTSRGGSSSSSFTVPPPPPSTPRYRGNLPSRTSPSFPQRSESPKSREPQFAPGDRVRHDKFGEGVIVKSQMEGGTEFVDVIFDGFQGPKRLSMDFAKLEKI